MKYVRDIYLFCLLIALLLFSGPGRTQYLIVADPGVQPNLETVTVKWQEVLRGQLFAVLPDVRPLTAAGIHFTVLDNDVETGKYFLLEPKGSRELQPAALEALEGCSVLWNDRGAALVRARLDLPQRLAGQYAPRRLWFRQLPPAPETASSPLARATASIIQAIIDSVSIDRIYTTEEHISGETPFLVNGEPDSIKTRYSNSPEIYKAQSYIENRLSDLGYATELQSFTLSVFYDVKFAPGQSDAGWLIAENKILGTSDGGQTWALQYTHPQGGTIWSLFPLDDQTVYAVGEYGLIAYSADGGASWTAQSSPTSNFLFGIYFSDAATGWICGDYGVVLKTTNGGTTWNTRSTPTSSRMYDIVFADGVNGWAVGQNGTILHSGDGGESWSSQASGTSSRLYGIHFLSAETGFAVGWSGRILKTVNGGANWTTLTSPTSAYLYDIDFINSEMGMIVGWDGTCLGTADGGNTWSAGAPVFGLDVYGLDLIDADVSWVGGDQLIATSTDGGGSWQMTLNNITESTLSNVIATKPGLLYPDQHYIICAHYDATSQTPMTRAPGADDNGSGTSTVIEAAQVVANYDFNYTIKFILFAGEEQGLHGSYAYVQQALANNEQILGVLNLDMTGYDGNNDGLVEIHEGTLSSSQALGNFVASNINPWGLALTPQIKTSNSTGGSDHSPFWSGGYPAILLIEDFEDFTPFYHTTNDLLTTLRPSYVLDNARLAIGSLALLAEIDSTSLGLEDDLPLVQDFRIYAPYPNPFNPEVTIRYDLPRAETVEVEVFDLLGRKVTRLLKERQTAGSHQLSWNSTNAQGATVPSGVYLLRWKVGVYQQVQKVVLIR